MRKESNIGNNHRTFRAAYWTDGQSDVQLTQWWQRGFSDEQMMRAAESFADEIGLTVGDGKIVIGVYTEK